jgi:uncharacterized OB-fold protein
VRGGEFIMGLNATYLGMPLDVNELDVENIEYFRHCAAHAFHLQQCAACGLVRYPPTTACPWCAELSSRWVPVEGRGSVHSYTEVHHAIQPAFRGHTPYLILLVDRQSGDARRRAGAARSGAPRRHRYARAHGLHRRRAGPVAAAVDDRRGRECGRHRVALSGIRCR